MALDYVNCPLVDNDLIEDIECIETREFIDEILIETFINERYVEDTSYPFVVS